MAWLSLRGDCETLGDDPLNGLCLVRRGQVRVALHEVQRQPPRPVLHRAQVDTGHHQAARAGVAQDVGRHSLEPCTPARRLEGGSDRPVG